MGVSDAHGFAALPLAVLAAAALSWTGPRVALWGQSWRAHTQMASATLPTCAAAQAAGRAWAAELRGDGGAGGAAGIDARAGYWRARVQGGRYWDFLPPPGESGAVRTYGNATANGWDGTKRLFDIERLAAARPREASAAGAAAACVIYSFGSNLQTEFEEAMLRATSCDLVTFDCTVRTDAIAAKLAAAASAFAAEGAGAGSVPSAAAVAAAAARMRFFPYCVGKEGRRVAMRIGGAGPPVETTLRSVGSIMAELRHTHVDLLKMDAEGAEHSALVAMAQEAMAARPGAAALLPQQLSLELHDGADGLADSLRARFNVVAALVDVGYVLVSRDDNVVYPSCCTELTFILGCRNVG